MSSDAETAAGATRQGQKPSQIIVGGDAVSSLSPLRLPICLPPRLGKTRESPRQSESKKSPPYGGPLRGAPFGARSPEKRGGKVGVRLGGATMGQRQCETIVA